MTRHRPTASLLAALCLAALGCGSDGGSAQAPPPTREETAHELPKLERGWKPYVNRAGGFAVGRPPGWSIRARGIDALMRAPDELVAVAITVDRTRDALAVPVDQYAIRAFSALPGYEENLEPSEPRAFRAGYRAVVVEGRATAARTGVPQRLRVIVLRRRGVATITATVAANAAEDTGGEERDALQAVRTIRTRPPAARSG